MNDAASILACEILASAGVPLTGNPLAGAPVQPRDAALLKAKNLFGSAEIVTLGDARFAADLRTEFRRRNFDPSTQVVAVECGPASNIHVLALGMRKENESFVKGLFGLNQLLFKSIRTVWRDIAFCWVRIEDGWRPTDHELAGALWISTGLVPAVELTQPATGALPFPEHGKTVATIRFDDLKWPPEIHETFLLAQIEDEHGKVILRTGPRKRTFNVQTVAHFLATLSSLVYDTNSGGFFMHLASAPEPKPMNQAQLTHIVSIFLQQQAKKCPAPFAILNTQVTAVVTMLKTICAVQRPDEREGLLAYVRERLERRPGANLTTSEIFTHYHEDCKTLGVPAFPECVFRDVLPKMVREHFGLTKTHDIRRLHEGRGELTSRNGFNGLAFTTHPAVDGTDAVDATDRTDGAIEKVDPPDPKTTSMLS